MHGPFADDNFTIFRISGVFTAPVNGLYHFTASFQLEGVGSLIIVVGPVEMANIASFKTTNELNGQFSTALTAKMDAGDEVSEAHQRVMHAPELIHTLFILILSPSHLTEYHQLNHRLTLYCHGCRPTSWPS